MIWPADKMMSTATAQKLIEALLRIKVASDIQMADGDFARDQARDALYAAHTEVVESQAHYPPLNDKDSIYPTSAINDAKGVRYQFNKSTNTGVCSMAVRPGEPEAFRAYVRGMCVLETDDRDLAHKTVIDAINAPLNNAEYLLAKGMQNVPVGTEASSRTRPFVPASVESVDKLCARLILSERDIENLMSRMRENENIRFQQRSMIDKVVSDIEMLEKAVYLTKPKLEREIKVLEQVTMGLKPISQFSASCEAAKQAAMGRAGEQY